MQIALNDEEIEEFMAVINRYAQDHPILVDKYLQGKEIEVDAVCDGTDILIPGIMEHIERTGSTFRRQYFRISGTDDRRGYQSNHRRIYRNVWQKHFMSSD